MPSITAAPAAALVDQALGIRLEGFPPGAAVELAAETTLVDDRRWRSLTRFVADTGGAVDLARAAPLSGGYAVPDPMGPVWSMEPAPEDPPGRPFRDVLGDFPLRFAAIDPATGEAACAEVQRRYAAPGVTRRRVAEAGVVGSLFLPPRNGAARPAVVTLSGSGGGVNVLPAAMLASRGYAALALGYFGMPGLPPYLADIPLEYFAGAFAWLRRQPGVAPERVAVHGLSRGGELALLLGATFPEHVRAVVAYAPSGVLHGPVVGQEAAHLGGTAAAWTLGGEGLPHLGQGNRAEDPDAVDWTRPPIALTPLFRALLRDAAAVERAAIPVERIDGPVLMVSGADDQMWPAAEMGELATQRLRAHGHRFRVEHLVYEAAGHLIGRPYAPTTTRHSLHPVHKVDYAYGGSTAGDARAAADSWPRVLAFLEEALLSARP